jgi:hypothetical protein
MFNFLFFFSAPLTENTNRTLHDTDRKKNIRAQTHGKFARSLFYPPSQLSVHLVFRSDAI